MGKVNHVNIIAGDGTVYVDGRDVGATQGGVFVEYSNDFKEVFDDKFDDAVQLPITKTRILVKTNMAEATLRNLGLALGVDNSNILVGGATWLSIRHITVSTVAAGIWQDFIDSGSSTATRGTVNKGTREAVMPTHTIQIVGNAPNGKVRTYSFYSASVYSGTEVKLSRQQASILPVTFRVLPHVSALNYDYGRITDGSEAQLDLFVENFDYDDGLLPAPWVNAQDIWGDTYYDYATVANGELKLYPLHDNVADPTFYLMGHWAMGMDTGRNNNIEVGLQFFAEDYLGQVGPAALMNFNAAPTEMGVCALYDISLVSIIKQNVFRTNQEIGNVFDTDYYDVFDATGNTSNFPGATNPGGNIFPLGLNTVVIRIVNGVMRTYWNGYIFGTDVPVPAYATGTYAGIHVIGFSKRVGVPPDPEDYGTVTNTWRGFGLSEDLPFVPPPANDPQSLYTRELLPERIVKWWWRSCSIL